jgi:hypothetical protein
MVLAGGVRRRCVSKATYAERCPVIFTRLVASASRYLSIPYRIDFIADMGVEAHTGKPPFSTILNDFAVVIRLTQGERPSWPITPAQGHDVSAGVKDLSERCWNSDPAQRPTAQAIVKALALEISQDFIVPQVLPPPPIASNMGTSAVQEASKKPTSFSYNPVTRDHATTTTVAGRGIHDGSGISKQLKRHKSLNKVTDMDV